MRDFTEREEHSACHQMLSNRILVIAEVAQAHDGSLGMAHAYIDAIAKVGADAVKFQTHVAAAESTPGEPWRLKFSPRSSAWRPPASPSFSPVV
jgi:hypothetical protein